MVVFRRELRSYFATPLAYVFIVIFLVLAAVFTFQVGGFLERNQADFATLFPLASVAVPGADPGHLNATLGRGTQQRQH